MTHIVDGRPAVSLKSSTEMAEVLRSAFNAAVPGKRLNKAHWSTLFLNGDIPDSQFYQLVDASWQWAVSRPAGSDAPNAEYLTRQCLFAAEYPRAATCDEHLRAVRHSGGLVRY